jgi:serine/threonine-protein kinase RsbT
VIRTAKLNGTRSGLEIVARDSGPGIENEELAMRDGYTTSDGLGLGLPGTRRLMDVFELQSQTGKGTTVRVGKWLDR